MINSIRIRTEAFLFTLIYTGISGLVSTYRGFHKQLLDRWTDGWTNFIPDLPDSVSPNHLAPTSRTMRLKMKVFF